MGSVPRVAAAVLAGAGVAAAVAQTAAVIAMMAMFGIPLGMEPREPSPAQYGVLLALGGLSAWAGSRVSARIGGARRVAATRALAAILAAGALWAFTRPPSAWPSWWAPALAAVAAAGACAAGCRRRASVRPH